ncbi:hypothetical protein P8H27_11405 [Pseudomonas sp. sp1636]|uniref:hypothetical protein n=1 Tax=Pseudomonas sp. sp1636 TaxID=3036707 RepID=UPI0025A5E2CE|nr:hypothetical protein [Pseudomonas sp. sp1636]MDM8349501.1 hypothetical protein [Pseudomonas sp. sp1636]
MKTLLSMTALAALMMGAAVTTVQAEGGSDRLMDYRLEQQAVVNNRSSQDSGERFAQMIEEQPTAAGPEREQQTQRIEKSQRGILNNRLLFGPH